MSTRSGPQTVEQEIERKFIVRSLPIHPPLVARLLESSYLAAGDPEVRIARYVEGSGRIVEGSYQLTVKGGAGIRRTEAIVDITDQVGNSIWSMTEPTTRMRKMRGWFVGGWELDIYEGRHKGLHVAEIELPAEDAPLPTLPEGMELGPEVTDDPAFKNKALATVPRVVLEMHLFDLGVRL